MITQAWVRGVREGQMEGRWPFVEKGRAVGATGAGSDPIELRPRSGSRGRPVDAVGAGDHGPAGTGPAGDARRDRRAPGTPRRRARSHDAADGLFPTAQGR